MRVEVSQVIDRPVAEVFSFYADDHVRNHPRWDPDMELEQVTEGPVRVGTIIRRRNTHNGRPVEGTMEVVELPRVRGGDPRWSRRDARAGHLRGRRSDPHQPGHQRKLGSSNLAVSALGLGCMGLSFGYARPTDKQEAISLIRSAVEPGGDLLRHGPGVRSLPKRGSRGRALAPFGDHVVIATKFGFEFDADGKQTGLNSGPITSGT